VRAVEPLAAAAQVPVSVVASSEVRSDDVPVLSVRSLSVSFPSPAGGEGDVVSDVSFDIAAGEVLALVGESGCGKSISALSIPALVPDPGQVRAGSIRLDGEDLVGMSPDAMSSVRGRRIGFVFQEPSASLNPAFTIGWQLRQPLQRHLHMSRSQARARSIELLARVGIPDPANRIDAFPHEFSGGMAQRVMIAMALACEPRLLIADEPTTALDVTVQGQVLDLLLGLRDDLGMAVLLITHDLGVVSDVADRAAVMYAGQIVEQGTVRDVFGRPAHPYTAGLLEAVPRNEARSGPRASIAGSVPPPWEWPAACRFAPRCPYAMPSCDAAQVLDEPTPGRLVRCARAAELTLVGVA
jgi:peptide/nickel transport system permease protein